MTLKWKLLLVAFVTLLAAFGTGCSGINASHSVSPASLLIPGLLKADPPVEAPDSSLPLVAAPSTQVAAR